MGGDAPEVSKGILNEAGAVSVELVLNRLQELRAFCGCTLDHVVDIGKIDVEAHRAAPTVAALVCPAPMLGFSSASMMWELPILSSA